MTDHPEVWNPGRDEMDGVAAARLILIMHALAGESDRRIKDLAQIMRMREEAARESYTPLSPGNPVFHMAVMEEFEFLALVLENSPDPIEEGASTRPPRSCLKCGTPTNRICPKCNTSRWVETQHWVSYTHLRF